MKKALSRIVSLLLVLCLVTALVPAVFAADENEVQILFLDTSDVHGQQFATDYTQDASLSGTHYQSMTRRRYLCQGAACGIQERIPQRLRRHHPGHAADVLLTPS